MSYYKSDTKENYGTVLIRCMIHFSTSWKTPQILCFSRKKIELSCLTYVVHIFLKSEFSFDNLQVLQLHYTTYTKLGTFSFWAISFHEMQSWYYIAIINAFWGVSSSSRHNFYNFWMRNFIMIISLLFCSQRNPQWRYHSYVLTSIG